MPVGGTVYRGDLAVAQRGAAFLYANFTFNGASAPDASEGAPYGTAGTRLARTSAGLYTLTTPFESTLDVLSAVCMLEDPAKALTARISARNDSAGTFAVTFSHRAAQRVEAQVAKAVDSAAATTTDETAFGRAAEAFTVDAAYFVPSAALTASDTDNATITVSQYTSAGASKTTVATITTDTESGDWVAFAPKALTLSETPANLAIPAGGCLSFEIAKTGDGVVVPAGTLVITGTTSATGVVDDPTDGAKLHVLLVVNQS